MGEPRTNGVNGVSHGPKRAVRVAGVSGGAYDRLRGIEDLSKDPNVDVIVGDWMSEITMAVRSVQTIDKKAGISAIDAPAFEVTFIDAIEPALKNLAKHGQKVAVNAGASDIEAMANRVRELCKEQSVDLKVSWIEGDDVTDVVKDMIAKGEKFPSLPKDENLADWGFEPVAAQCYLGGQGIAEAFRAGADIVICGRVADASPVIGAATWWHGWRRDQFQELASALVAGHLIECSTYVSGGNYTGFKKEVLHSCTEIGFPIAEIEADGGIVITKEKNTDGLVTRNTVTSQLLYEIQGPFYYNSDATAQLDQMKVEQEGKDRVRVSGIIGHPPPPTTKVGITARGGWQAEYHYFLTGLDIKEKALMVERQTIASMGDAYKKFHVLKFIVSGTVPENPQSQDEATVDLKIFAQSRDPDVIGGNVHVTPDKPGFARWCLENCLQGYPGSTMFLDMRQAAGKPYLEYWVALLPQDRVDHIVHHHDGRNLPIPAPTKTQVYPRQQPSSDTQNALPPSTWGETVKAPLGYIVHARSGDKSSDCNVGFYVRHDDEWDWLRSTLSLATIRQLLGNDDTGGKIDRFELPNMRAVHFLLRDHLDRGCNSTSTYDFFGKNCAEYLRARWVDIPKMFLDRGTI